jgi:hypothetical protein
LATVITVEESRGQEDETVITVITPQPSVITVITDDEQEEISESKAFEFPNTPLELRTVAKALREMRGLILTEINNLSKGNGKKESIEARLKQRKEEFLKLYETHESALEVHYVGLVEQKKKLFQD